MLLEDYIKELENDLKINELNLKDYQLMLPGVKHKWAGRCIRHKLQINDLRKKREQLKRSLVEKIQEQSPVKLALTVIERTADKCSEVADIDNQIKELELIIELLEKSEKTLSSASYDLKNIIEIIKLETT
jgi:predicted nuclease with TOPRIM domain